MRTLTLRRAAVVAALPLALSSLAACGNATSQTATDPQAGATSTPSTRDSGSSSAKPVSKTQFLAMVKSASKKVTTARVSMKMDMSGQSVPVTGVLDMTGDSPAMQMSMTMAGGGSPTEMRLVDKTLYLQMPGGSSFYKIDLTDPNGPMGSLGGDALTNLDPGALASDLSPAMLRKVTDRGVSTVGGQRLHHYTVSMDLGAAPKLAHLPSTVSLPKTATYDVWLDDQGRFARFVMLMKGAIRISAAYSDYGTAAHVVAPPASDVTAMPGTGTNG